MTEKNYQNLRTDEYYLRTDGVIVKLRKVKDYEVFYAAGCFYDITGEFAKTHVSRFDSARHKLLLHIEEPFIILKNID